MFWYLVFGVLCTLALLALPVSADVVRAAEATPPNVLILYADDLGFGDLGVYNPDSKIPTPHLDRLARQGMQWRVAGRRTIPS